MASPRIALIHALRDSVEPAMTAMARGWPDARIANLLDDSLSADLAARKGLFDDAIFKRFEELSRYAVRTGADGILFTCSAFGEPIERARVGLNIPVLKPNEAALEDALERGPRIALVATFPATIPSMTRELEQLAASCGIVPTIMTRVVDGALEALQAGDQAKHIALILEAASDYARADALLLAQFSMARAASWMTERGFKNVLTTPDSAVAKLRRLVTGA
jgi:hypothetical protein